MDRQKAVLCPSSLSKDGAIVLGIVLQNHTIAYADRRYRLDGSQAEAMRSAPVAAEKRFRFAGACAQCGCGQWQGDASGGRCGVIEEVLAAPPDESLPRVLPSCSIREQCRWYLQRGDEACGVCRYVITDTAVMT